MNAAEKLAALFHATYERLAPSHGYIGKAVPWSDVKDPNRTLMIDVAAAILAKGYRRTWSTLIGDDVQFPPPADCGAVEDPEGTWWLRTAEGYWASERDLEDEHTWSAALFEAGVLREVSR